MIPYPAIGTRFGALVVSGPETRLNGRRMVTARCDCGAEKTTQLHAVISGHLTSCGCGAWWRNRNDATRVSDADLVGVRFGRLVIESVVGRTRWGRVVAALCDCGARRTLRLSELRGGRTRSCGCLKREVARASLAATSRTHGLHGRPGYGRWASMMVRCTDPTRRHYHRYGGRGITVCARWRDVASYLADIGEPPSKSHTMDRIDNDGGYWCGRAECPDCGPAGRSCNVRWATAREQARNACRNRVITHNGQSRCITEWAEVTGIRYATLRTRLALGWPVERALTTPPEPRFRNRMARSSGVALDPPRSPR